MPLLIGLEDTGNILNVTDKIFTMIVVFMHNFFDGELGVACSGDNFVDSLLFVEMICLVVRLSQVPP